MAHWQYFREAMRHVHKNVQDELVWALIEIVFVQDQNTGKFHYDERFIPTTQFSVRSGHGNPTTGRTRAQFMCRWCYDNLVNAY
eukprot:2107529-Rhodomonas_salina.1